MGMRVATAIMRSTGSITSTRRLACVGLLLLGLGACASTPKYADSLTPPLSRLDVTSTFGQRTASRPHYGIDLAASKGTKVMAAADGKVVFAGKQRGFGKIVILDHGGGTQTYYAHLSRISVSEGKRVSRGNTIGLVGQTGNATGPHLHFEVREGGRPVDPLLKLSTRTRG